MLLAAGQILSPKLCVGCPVGQLNWPGSAIELVQGLQVETGIQQLWQGIWGNCSIIDLEDKFLSLCRATRQVQLALFEFSCLQSCQPYWQVCEHSWHFGRNHLLCERMDIFNILMDPGHIQTKVWPSGIMLSACGLDWPACFAVINSSRA